MLDIPMNTKPPMGLGDLENMTSGSAPNHGQQQQMQQGFIQQNQGGWGGQGLQQQNWAQPQQGFNQAPPPMQAQPVQNSHPAATGVILRKGQKTSLTQMSPNLDNIEVGLGWDIKNQACDLDASAFMLGDNGKVVGDDWFVFYGQERSPDGSIVHRGDSRDGAGYGDDELISIRLSQMNPNVKKVVFVVTINEALDLGLNFSMVANAYVRIIDKSTNRELCRFNLTDYYANVTSMVVGEIYRHNGEFKLNPVGDGVARDLAGLCEMYGVNVVG